MSTIKSTRQSFVGCLKVPLFLLCVLAVVAFGAAPALAATEGPGWEVTAHTVPTYLPPEGAGTVFVNVFNVGAGASHGSITVTDVLPAGVTATEAGNLVTLPEAARLPEVGQEQWACTGNAKGESPRAVSKFQAATVVTCTNVFEEFQGGGGSPTNTVLEGPNLQPQVAIVVQAGGEARGLVNHVTVAGGGAPSAASAEQPVTVSSGIPEFGFANWDGWFSNADGTLDTQAGSHPYEATFSFDLAEADVAGNLRGAGGEARDIEVRLPPGLVINPLAVPQCTREQLAETKCPAASQVGVLTTYFNSQGGSGWRIYNLVPPPGVPGEVGFNLEGIYTLLDGAVRSGSSYGITAQIKQIKQIHIVSVVTTLWDVPGEASHDRWRNGLLGGCSPEEVERGEGNCQGENTPITKPYLTLPTKCGSLEPTVISADSWNDEGHFVKAEYGLHDSNGLPAQITGCEQLGFGPVFTTEPDTAKADTPAGLTVQVKPPVGGLEEQNGLSTSDIKDTTVMLPPGFVINPGQAAGLQACGPAEDGLTTPQEKEKGEEDNGPANCPNASKVGTVTIRTPLLEQAEQKQLEGNVYVLQSNPPELKLLVAASADGVNLKLVGIASLCERAGEERHGKVCEAPGQIITSFAETPELPFTDFKLSFSGGAQAALDTPAQCGTYTSTSDFTPWGSNFIPDVSPTASFNISEGPAGGACPASPLPFAPTLTAGSTSDQAGGFTNFSMLLQRGDGQQRIEKLQFKAPAGLSGMLSSVPLCDEAQANAGTCPAASKIGHAVVSSGPGPYPLVLPQPGEPELPIYLTGPYQGAPFGLSIVTPVLAGPFNLGTIVTRAKIEVDPHTAQITVTTNPLPQVVAGVPTDLRSVDAVIDRPGFMFNPTNCNPQSFSGTAWGTPPAGAGGPGATAAISSPFGVGSCQSLKFAPKFAVSTSGRTTKAGGASLTAKLTYPKAAQGTQSNITRVKVDLPKQLPSRLTTLQKACTNAQFELNPANCPKESKIGYATVHTPLLPVPVSGPAIFVSHGGEAFPSLTMVLQGDGVTVDLVGTTFISHAGITSTTFKTVPDVPFSTFELTLGQGKFSALAANLPAKDHGNFCGQTLKMPTEFLAQNGLKINESTKLGVSGCPKHKAKKASKDKHGKRGTKHKKT